MVEEIDKAEKGDSKAEVTKRDPSSDSGTGERK
jgi:hypothetical protein